MTEHINEVNFDEKVLNADVPVLVDFYSESCGPCRMLAPIIDKLSNEAQGKYAVYKVNVNQSPALADKFDIMSIPTLIVFRCGKAVCAHIGCTDAGEILKLIETAV